MLIANCKTFWNYASTPHKKANRKRPQNMDKLLKIKKLLETKTALWMPILGMFASFSAYTTEEHQPQKQDIAASEWDTHRRRFPDWQPVGIQYQKFRRHYLIAQEAQNFLFTQP